MFDKAERLSLTHMWVAFAAFAVAAILGFYQVLALSGIAPQVQSQAIYFGAISTHGTLMGYVLTTFFIMGFGYYIATTSLQRPLWNKPLAWLGFWVALAGTVIAAVPLVLGQASVLYTFYPPHQAHSAYYIGATLLVVGSWAWAVIMLTMMVQWKRGNPGQPVPLAMFAMSVNAALWLWTSVGVGAEMLFQLIPWSLGWTDTIDVGLARTLFSWTLHAIVYFWLIPAYIVLYAFLPRAAGGRLFSDELGRVAFIMLLVFSLPVGFHHLFMDPEHSAGFKLFHTISTFGVMVPTLITGFTIMASMEIAGRLRGGRGLFGWILSLDRSNPVVLASVFAFLFLILGGFGGFINSSYAMNAMVHNTAWVTAHFHLIFGGTTVILYMAGAYYMWPKLTGRPLHSNRMVLTQLWLWFIGMVVTTTPWHIVGLMAQPRRISSIVYEIPQAAQWYPYQVVMVFGGLILMISALLFVYNLLRSHYTFGVEADRELHYAQPLHPVLRVPRVLNGLTLWNWILVFYMIAAFGYPIAQFFILNTYDSPPWGI
ncbi:cbb3-type cytochrome c oxidase subunit I [Ectothiorhodospiraceae bacterium 2226]|nr:cbb3-type cytochrome c oxidase subunit I [Ectothiorhodospiraceae bacterium 2226]